MADQLCTEDDLSKVLGITVDSDRATVLIECGTAVVQAAAGNQRIVEVEDDEGTQMGLTDSWLEFPQRPVSEVSEVSIDGGDALVEGTDFKRFGARLWRRCGWAECWPEPSTVTYVYTHGYPSGSQDLQLGRSAVLGLIRAAYNNPNAVEREAIDDYSVTFAVMSSAMEANENLRMALLRKYGPRVGLARVG